jgi:hypothetical protein
MRDTIVIIGVLFFFFLGGYIVGISQNFCARQALQSKFTEYNVKRLEKQLKDRDRSYKMGQCQNLLLSDHIK